jgi:colanic acid/amylovoran biosynthesis glycosyltransferase
VRVCIITPAEVGLTETFIRAHIERLPRELVQLRGHGLDLTCDGQKLQQWFNCREKSTCESLMSALPRFLEFRMRRRFFPAPNDVEIAASFLRHKRTDVVLAEYGTTGAFITPACRAAKVPLVVHFHGFDASRYSVLEEFKESYHRMFAYASKVIAVSKSMRQKLLDMGCPADKLVVNPYGPDPAFFDVKPDYGANDILAVGRLTEKKAPHLLLLAFQGALKTCPGLRLRVIGDGELRSVCEDLVKALGIKETVCFEGAVSPATIRERMAASFLFVQHSVTARDGDSEGTPVAVLEAGAAGLPVVSTRHAGIPEVVIPGETGSLVDERDVAGMSAAIADFALDRAVAQKMGAAARRHIASHFTMEQHLSVINEAIEAAVVPATAALQP